MSFFKLGKMTIGSLFKKPATTRYPFESRPQPKGLKGQIAIDVDKCILCGACARNCSTGCLTVNRNERTWQIDPYGCIQCSYCISTCPKDCLYMLPDYTPAASQKTAKRFDIPESASNKGKAKASTSKKEASDPISKPAQEQPSKEVIDALEEADQIPSQVDYQIADLIDLMDDNRAAIVRKALEKGAL